MIATALLKQITMVCVCVCVCVCVWGGGGGGRGGGGKIKIEQIWFVLQLNSYDIFLFVFILHKNIHCIIHNTVCSMSDCGSRGYKFESQLGHITFMEINHEIISTIMLPFHWFKKDGYQFLDKACAQVMLRGLSLPK